MQKLSINCIGEKGINGSTVLLQGVENVGHDTWHDIVVKADRLGEGFLVHEAGLLGVPN